MERLKAPSIGTRYLSSLVHSCMTNKNTCKNTWWKQNTQSNICTRTGQANSQASVMLLRADAPKRTLGQLGGQPHPEKVAPSLLQVNKLQTMILILQYILDRISTFFCRHNGPDCV